MPIKSFRHCGIHTTRTCNCDETSTEAVLQAWRDWLASIPWNHFVTVTYRKPRRARSDGGDLSRVLRTIRRHVPNTRVFLAGEAHISGDLHVHGLIHASGRTATHERLERRWLWQDLYKAYGRSDVQAVREVQDVLDYGTKYVTKQMASYLLD